MDPLEITTNNINILYKYIWIDVSIEQIRNHLETMNIEISVENMYMSIFKHLKIDIFINNHKWGNIYINHQMLHLLQCLTGKSYLKYGIIQIISPNQLITMEKLYKDATECNINFRLELKIEFNDLSKDFLLKNLDTPITCRLIG